MKRGEFAALIARGLGNNQPSQDLLVAISAWTAAEGGLARYNPLNTIQPWPGATNYNSVGVKNYPSASAGYEAIMRTLWGNFAGYDDIRAGITNNDVARLRRGIGVGKWGTPLSLLDSVIATRKGVENEELPNWPDAADGGIAAAVGGALAGGVPLPGVAGSVQDRIQESGQAAANVVGSTWLAALGFDSPQELLQVALLGVIGAGLLILGSVILTRSLVPSKVISIAKEAL